MSRSDPFDDRPLTFDGWIRGEFAARGPFTALVVLVEIGETTVTPLRSTWVHVVGLDLDWPAVAKLLNGAGAAWDGVAFAPRTDPRHGGPLADPAARAEVLALGQTIGADRLVLNAEHFFDRLGRRLQVEEVTPQ